MERIHLNYETLRTNEVWVPWTKREWTFIICHHRRKNSLFKIKGLLDRSPLSFENNGYEHTHTH